MKFEWTEKCQHSFEQLKLKLTIAHIINIADPNQEFVVCTHACGGGLGGVLLQENSIITYQSRKIKKHVQNYSVYDLELVDVVHAFKILRH